MGYNLSAQEKKSMEQLLRDRAAEEERTFRRKNVSILKPPAKLMEAFSHITAILQSMGYQPIIGEQGESIEFRLDSSFHMIHHIREAAETQIALLWQHREFNVIDAYGEIDEGAAKAQAEATELLDKMDPRGADMEGADLIDALANPPEVVSL